MVYPMGISHIFYAIIYIVTCLYITIARLFILSKTVNIENVGFSVICSVHHFLFPEDYEYHGYTNDLSRYN